MTAAAVAVPAWLFLLTMFLVLPGAAVWVAGILIAHAAAPRDTPARRALAAARRRTRLVQAIAVTVGLLVGLAVALAAGVAWAGTWEWSSLGALAAAAGFLAGAVVVAVGEAGGPRPSRRTRSAGLEPRTIGRLAPSALRGAAAASAVLLALVGLACAVLGGRPTPPTAGETFPSPTMALTTTVLGLAAAGVCVLGLVLARDRAAVEGLDRQADVALRRVTGYRALRCAVGGCALPAAGLLVAATAAPPPGWQWLDRVGVVVGATVALAALVALCWPAPGIAVPEDVQAPA